MNRPPRSSLVLAFFLISACGSSGLEVGATPPDAAPNTTTPDAAASTLDAPVTSDAPVTDAPFGKSDGPPGDTGTPSTCGNVGQPCCPGLSCPGPGAGCVKNSCIRCGGAGEPCCPPPAGSPIGSSGICGKAGLVCDPATAFCTVCGSAGAACCDGNTCTGGACCFAGACVAAGQACDQGSALAGTCTGGVCTGCGNVNQPCCGEGATATCGKGQTCQGDRCLRCGGPGETCCPATATSPACTGGNSCGADNTCVKCGGPGEACCAGSKCNAGGCCFTARCVTPGTQCSFEGKTYGTCADSKCACGGAGQPCCPGAFTNGSQQWSCTDPGASCAAPAGTANVRTCTGCGTIGGPCCSDKACREKGAACLAQPPEGFRCRKCGGDGDPCCSQPGVPEPFCDPGLSVHEDNVAHTCRCGV